VDVTDVAKKLISIVTHRESIPGLSMASHLIRYARGETLSKKFKDAMGKTASGTRKLSDFGFLRHKSVQWVTTLVTHMLCEDLLRENKGFGNRFSGMVFVDIGKSNDIIDLKHGRKNLELEFAQELFTSHADSHEESGGDASGQEEEQEPEPETPD
jgi:hypothetical protein